MAGNNDEITLQPKNGKKHVLFVDVTKQSMFGSIETIGNEKVERIISAMQDKGYEIVDMKFTALSGVYMSVLIMYK